jgi:hypothetical protein
MRFGGGRGTVHSSPERTIVKAADLGCLVWIVDAPRGFDLGMVARVRQIGEEAVARQGLGGGREWG